MSTRPPLVMLGCTGAGAFVDPTAGGRVSAAGAACCDVVVFVVDVVLALASPMSAM